MGICQIWDLPFLVTQGSSESTAGRVFGDQCVVLVGSVDFLEVQSWVSDLIAGVQFYVTGRQMPSLEYAHLAREVAKFSALEP